MSHQEVLHNFFKKSVAIIHQTRFKAVCESVMGVCFGHRLTITQIGRSIRNQTTVKHNIKKVDRLCGNPHLQREIPLFYSSMTNYLLAITSASTPIIVDVCFLKDHHELQTIRASLSIENRSLTLYEMCYSGREVRRAHQEFLNRLHHLLPKNRQIIILLDAGFRTNWCQQITRYGWDWISRLRRGSGTCYLSDGKWYSISALFEHTLGKIKDFGRIVWTKNHRLTCRLVGFSRKIKGRRNNNYLGNRSQRKDSKKYSRYYREPWLLATTLHSDEYSAQEIARWYEKRMQIEAGFRDLKSHQFGLGARYSRTKNVSRWNVLLLLANVALFILWMIGVHLRNRNLQWEYQSNTRRNRKEFSDIFLGRIFLSRLFYDDFQRRMEKHSGLFLKKRVF